MFCSFDVTFSCLSFDLHSNLEAANSTSRCQKVICVHLPVVNPIGVSYVGSVVMRLWIVPVAVHLAHHPLHNLLPHATTTSTWHLASKYIKVWLKNVDYLPAAVWPPFASKRRSFKEFTKMFKASCAPCIIWGGNNASQQSRGVVASNSGELLQFHHCVERLSVLNSRAALVPSALLVQFWTFLIGVLNPGCPEPRWKHRVLRTSFWDILS